MIIDRRDFIAGAAFVAVAPTIELLPPSIFAPVSAGSSPAFSIVGWSARDKSDTANQIWISINRSWRVAWR